MTATAMPAENMAQADKTTLTTELVEAEKRLTSAIARRDARAAELAQARSDAATAQTLFEDGKGTPAAAAQARALVDVLTSALAKNEAAVNSTTSARDEVLKRLTRAQDLIDVERLAGELATGLAAMKAKRRKVVSAFREGVAQFCEVQSQTGAAQKELAEVLNRLFASEDGKASAKAAFEYVEQLGRQGIDVSAVHLRIDPNTSCWLASGAFVDSTLRLESIDGWEREFDKQSGRG